MPRTARELHSELRKHLWEASDAGALRTAPHDVVRLLKQARSETHEVVLGGEKNLGRTRDKGHFTRDDGAWFDFSITVEERRGEPLELVAYDFEIRFPEPVRPHFVRFDLNTPGHDNAGDGLRSHLHPGNDDMQAPAPLLAPVELLDVILYGMRGRAKARTKGMPETT